MMKIILKIPWMMKILSVMTVTISMAIIQILVTIDHSDLDSNWNSDHNSWFSLENYPGNLPVSQKNPHVEASPHEARSEEQPLASWPTKSQVVMAKELAQLAHDTLADQCNYFSPVCQTCELEGSPAFPSP